MSRAVPAPRPAVVWSARLFAVALSATSLQAQPVSYSQGTFDPLDWNKTVLTQIGAGLTDNTAVTAGGAAWRIDISRPRASGDSQLRVAMINPLFTYDPQVNGLISTLSFRFDLFGVSSAGFSGTHLGFYRPIIRQNGTFFSVSGGNAIPQLSVPTTFAVTYTPADNWVSAVLGDPTQLDFTGAAGLLEFGFRYETGSVTCATTCSGYRYVTELDNFAMTVTPVNPVSTVPEPSTYALLASGLAVMGFIRRRQRRANG